MPGNATEVEIDVGATRRALREMADSVPDEAAEGVRMLSVLAEGEIKERAPEGAGRDEHLRDTVDTRFGRNGLFANVGPRKRVGDEQILLAAILADRPQWDPENPPPLGPLSEWTAAKWGDGSIAAAARLRHSLVEDGMESAPNDFVEEAFEAWKSQVEPLMGDQMRDAIARLRRAR